MSEVANLVAELKDIHHEQGGWHGAALRKILAGVTAEHAVASPIPGYRSIWELVLHISHWQEVFRLRIEGTAMSLPAEGDWPPVRNTSEAAWQEALAFLDQVHEKLIGSVSALKDSDLDRIVPGKPYTIAWMLHGLVRHHVYHAGQIAMIKRLVARP